jgi:hypothetical protein
VVDLGRSGSKQRIRAVSRPNPSFWAKESWALCWTDGPIVTRAEESSAGLGCHRATSREVGLVRPSVGLGARKVSRSG